MDCTIYVAKTKVLISCAVTAQLICAFVFAYAKSRSSHDAAQYSKARVYKGMHCFLDFAQNIDCGCLLEKCFSEVILTSIHNLSFEQ